MSAFWQGFEKSSELAKRRYKTLQLSELDPADTAQAWTAKIDGAHTIVEMSRGDIPQLFSHRISKRSGSPIPYNPKLLHIKSPSQVTARLRGETYAVGPGGRAVDPELVTALLNRGPARSLELQRELGLKTRTALIDVDSFDGKDMTSASFKEKRRVMAQIVAKNRDFSLPALATTAAAKTKLLDRILTGSHPQTREGLIVHDLHGTDYAKAKIVDHHDVYVRGIFDETGTKPARPKGMAGGFTYSWEPDGPVAGRVGTGFDHEMKRDMARNPTNYIGRVAKVMALGKSKKDALLKPSFDGWHVEKNLA